jgi:hypothetical protein
MDGAKQALIGQRRRRRAFPVKPTAWRLERCKAAIKNLFATRSPTDWNSVALGIEKFTKH